MRRTAALLAAAILAGCAPLVILTPGESLAGCTDAVLVDQQTGKGRCGGEQRAVTCGDKDGYGELTLDAGLFRCRPKPTSSTTTTAPTTTTVPPGSGALWHGDADTDTDRGDQTDCLDKNTESLPTSRLSIVADPASLHGDVYRAQLLAADIDAGQKRAEWSKTFTACDGDTELYLWEGVDRVRAVGWRSMFGGTVVLNGADNGGNYLQWKGDSSCGGPAVGMTINNNRLTLRTIDGDYLAWTDTVPLADRLGEWVDFVMVANFSKTSGWIEWWVDGQPQTMSDGTLRWEGPTVCPNDAEVWAKWGTYGMDDGAPVHWLESPRIGLTYAAVVPR